MPWNPPPGFPEAFYLILKVGGYCSGWMNGREPARCPLPFPTQEEWEECQQEILEKRGDKQMGYHLYIEGDYNGGTTYLGRAENRDDAIWRLSVAKQRRRRSLPDASFYAVSEKDNKVWRLQQGDGDFTPCWLQFLEVDKEERWKHIRNLYYKHASM